MYIIQEQGKIIFMDKDLQRLENSLKCVSDNKKMKIEEVSDTLIERAYDGSYYLQGYAPQAPEPTYAEKRAIEYPSIQDQLDMIYWDKINGTENWTTAIAEIKAKYPKE